MLWMITDFSAYKSKLAAYSSISSMLEAGAGMVTLRNRDVFPKEKVHSIAKALNALFHDKGVFIHDPDEGEVREFDFLHYPSSRLSDAISAKKLYKNKKIAVSLHDIEESLFALRAKVDYAFLSPVFKPLSKPDDTRPCVKPVKLDNIVLLGGINREKGEELIENGYKNIAGISLFLGGSAKEDVRYLAELINKK